MNVKYCILGLLILGMFCVSCDEKKPRPVYYEYDIEEDLEEEIEIPYRSENGVKYVKVSVNGVGLEMIFDTGCSTALISIAEANYLYQKGLLTTDDILGVTQSQIADGSIIEGMVVNLREVIIGGEIYCTDVEAMVVSNINAPLLLGNDVLDRSAEITIDNENNTIHFKLR